MKDPTGKIFSVAYTFNYITQAALSLICPAGFFIFLGWYLTEKKGCDSWVFAVLLIFGVICGFFCMIKYLVTMSYQLDLARKIKKADDTKRNGKSEEEQRK